MWKAVTLFNVGGNVKQCSFCVKQYGSSSKKNLTEDYNMIQQSHFWEIIQKY